MGVDGALQRPLCVLCCALSFVSAVVRADAEPTAADAQLEALVLASGPERDGDFLRFFHRRLMREEALLQPVLREQQDASLPPLV